MKMKMKTPTKPAPSASALARTRAACFLTSFSTAVTGNLPPLLFLTFREEFGISFSLLGLLVVVNFGTQLLCDLLFSFFSHRFNMTLCVRLMPWIMTGGLALFALAPILFPSAPYVGLCLGTVVFSAGGGLAEVLVSPTVAAIPADDPDRVMSRLHSSYAWGVVIVVLLSTGFFALCGRERWQLLTALLTLLPLTAALLMSFSPIPYMETQEKVSGSSGLFGNRSTLLYVVCIFLGGASECTMSQWCSGYVEAALGVDKTVGDVFGVALFGLMLAVGRTLYGRVGKHIHAVMTIGAAGAFVCYAAAVVSELPALGLAACALTGLCVSMLWPGSLIAVAEDVPHGGVALYALMAMGGDLGASLVPQAVGSIADAVIASPSLLPLAERLSLTSEQLGMKAGMAFACLFPLAAAVLFGFAWGRAKRKRGSR